MHNQRQNGCTLHGSTKGAANVPKHHRTTRDRPNRERGEEEEELAQTEEATIRGTARSKSLRLVDVDVDVDLLVGHVLVGELVGGRPPPLLGHAVVARRLAGGGDRAREVADAVVGEGAPGVLRGGRRPLVVVVAARGDEARGHGRRRRRRHGGGAAGLRRLRRARRPRGERYDDVAHLQRVHLEPVAHERALGVARGPALAVDEERVLQGVLHLCLEKKIICTCASRRVPPEFRNGKGWWIFIL